MQIIKVKTPKHNFELELYKKTISITKIKLQKQLFSNMCKKGCKNYNSKYTCPPFSPEFHKYLKDYKELEMILIKFDLNQLSKNNYILPLKLKIANAILKSKIENILKDKFSLSSGACRLCHPCQKQLNKPCRYPEKRHYSLESLGVDCNELSKKLFNIELKWYKNKTLPEYTCVMGAIPKHLKELKE